MDKVKHTWEVLAHFDPLWAIASRPGMEGNRWNVSEFMSTGVSIAEALMQLLRERCLTPDQDRILDFGCGVGRVTLALASYFRRCDGIDVSDRMIEFARQLNIKKERVHYHVSDSSVIPFPADTFDVVYSRLVLQHLPVPMQAACISEFIRVLKRSGIAVFQTPSAHRSEQGDVFQGSVEIRVG